MNTKDILKILDKKINFISKEEQKQVFENIIDILEEAIINNEEIIIEKFGIFRVITRREKKFEDVETGEIVHFREKRKIIFKPNRLLDEKITLLQD